MWGEAMGKLPPELAADYAACRQIMFAASKNYSFASRVLPPDKLPHVEALYALMRVGDDRVDVSATGFDSALDAIQDWETRYWDAFAQGRADHPVMRAYLHTALTYRIPPETMRPYFRAMRDDLTVTRFPTFADLLHYMEGSALPVGRALTHILGVRAPQTLAQALSHADSLATAMQLSNFWRDIAEDWARGRIYLPLEDMQRFGVAEAELSRGDVSPAFAALLQFEIARTESYYQHAYDGVSCLATGRWGVMSSLHIYHMILRDIRRRRYDVFTRRAGTNHLEKFACATLAWFETNGLMCRTIPGARTPEAAPMMEISGNA